MNKKRMIFDVVTIVLGNILYALGVVLFILPGGLITGGSTGIGILVNELTGLPISYFVMGFNLVMFIIGFAILGKKFALSTMISTITFPFALGILEKWVGNYVITQDIFLCTLFGGICIGTSIALVIRAGGSTGGMDIPPLVLHKYFAIPVSVSLYLGDCIILGVQGMFRDAEKVLYGIVLVLAYSIILDKLLILGTNKVQIKVVSNKALEIKDAILHEVDRGVTLLHGKTGYLERETEIVLTVISSRELYKVEKLVHEIDHHAFVMISRVSEVKGRGFSHQKKYLS